ncbi:hypothetical protein SAMN05421821_103327 [Mucilaginibacter lappiensis]|uniref:Uncharacterized protein n=1 Tax=Mucilaginibacter lappiensis TaxID=354630 RepID=A0A1N6VBX8_9SPHI|nr:hypothetical protein [Mucilaginibacter lappiensis]MBB6127317.1 hypothetical protein [Mucilaginibacter lappiensis]SIQ75239.1 hypothetical protein SAMN05421821_103327 [Mucilaginibacter lappiensis]
MRAILYIKKQEISEIKDKWLFHVNYNSCRKKIHHYHNIHYFLIYFNP